MAVSSKLSVKGGQVNKKVNKCEHTSPLKIINEDVLTKKITWNLEQEKNKGAYHLFRFFLARVHTKNISSK